jgi:hypothetical protein
MFWVNWEWPHRNTIFKALWKGDWSEVRRCLRYWRQWLTTGSSNDETWSLDHTFAALALPRLKRFRDIYCKHIKDTIHESDYAYESFMFYDALDVMIEAFEIVLDEDADYAWNKDHKEFVQYGLELFTQLYPGLWW